MTLLERVVHVLRAHDLPHALIGAGALAARGIARSTYDIDLQTTDARVLQPDTWDTLRAEDVAVEVRRGTRTILWAASFASTHPASGPSTSFSGSTPGRRARSSAPSTPLKCRLSCTPAISSC